MKSVFILWGIKENQRNILGVYQQEHTAKKHSFDYDDSYEYTEITSHDLIQSLPKNF